jgi:hypothetical protein
MPGLEGKPPDQTEVQADTGHSATPTAARDTGVYQKLLELSVVVVMLAFWLAGAALVGLCALAVYHLLWVLLGTLAIP